MTAHRGARVVQLSDRRTATPVPEPMPTPWQSVCQLGVALRTFGRELRVWAGAWLRDHQRAHRLGYVDGFRHGLDASPRRSA
jgi:hypothetical protein